MPTALVCVTNMISHPDDAWPVLHERLEDVWSKAGHTHLRLLLLSPNEIEVMVHAPLNVEIRLLEWAAIKSWTDRWMTDLLLSIGEVGPDISVFDRRMTKSQSPLEWRLDGVDELILIRGGYQPGVYSPLLEAAWERDVSVIRIDPENYEVFRVKKPRKEEP